MKNFKRVLALILTTVMLFCILSGCSDDAYTGDNSSASSGDSHDYTYDEAVKEMEAKVKKVTLAEADKYTYIYDLDDTPVATLADIDTFPLTVQGHGQINVEIAVPSELSGNAPDDLLNVIAKKFNSSGAKLDGKSVSVSIRKISSGEVVTYMTEGNYQPDGYIPSSYALGEMLKAKGIGVIKLTDRIAGNTAGILMKKPLHDDFVAKYGDVMVGKVLEAALDDFLVLSYTNVYTSATGLNMLTAMLASFDPSNPLSDQAAAKLLDYQRKSPPVAYTTGVMRTQAAKGIVSAMVMEEQAYINTPELKDYVYTPAGIRHDHPVYTFDYVSSEKQEVMRMFTDYCLSDASQKLATEKGFNRHDDYVSQDSGLDGAGYLAAQRIWKASKDGGRPVIAVFVADMSGSMYGEPLRALKNSLSVAAQYISSDNYVGLVTFSHKVYKNLEIAQFDETQRSEFYGAVNSMSADGGTATYDAILVALQMVHQKMEEIPNAKAMLFILSDGEQRDGYGINDVMNIVGGMRIPIYAIGYGLSSSDSRAAKELQRLSEINEAAMINAQTDDIINHLRNLFNVQL